MAAASRQSIVSIRFDRIESSRGGAGREELLAQRCKSALCEVKKKKKTYTRTICRRYRTRARIREWRGEGEGEGELESRRSMYDFQSVSSGDRRARERRDCIGWTLKELILREGERKREAFLFLVTDFKRIVRVRSPAHEEKERERSILRNNNRLRS